MRTLRTLTIRRYLGLVRRRRIAAMVRQVVQVCDQRHDPVERELGTELLGVLDRWIERCRQRPEGGAA